MLIYTYIYFKCFEVINISTLFGRYGMAKRNGCVWWGTHSHGTTMVDIGMRKELPVWIAVMAVIGFFVLFVQTSVLWSDSMFTPSSGGLKW